MSILFFDTETTGFAKPGLPTGHEDQPHCVQLAAILTDDQGQEEACVNVIIRPDGWTVPDAAAAIHGITTKKAARYGIREDQRTDICEATAEAVQKGVCYDEGTYREYINMHLLIAEARGAAEQRKKDAEGGLRPMSEAKKDKSVILAKVHDDLFPRLRPGRKDLEPWNGRWVVVSHVGLLEDGFDLGWSVAAPVGHGGLPDEWFMGWKPVHCAANAAALEARFRGQRLTLTSVIDSTLPFGGVVGRANWAFGRGMDNHWAAASA